MPEETNLPEEWQQLPQVKKLVEEAVQKARAPLAGIARERDELQSQLQQLKKELTQLRKEAEKPEKKTEHPAESAKKSPDDNQERQRLENLVKKQQERIKSLEEELQAKNRRLAEEVLERGIRDAVGKVGEVHKDAWPDVVARGKRTFTMDEQGRPVARDDAGNVLYGDDPLTPMSFEEWARKLLADAPHLFKASGAKGSGASGGSGQEGGAAAVTISKDEARNPLTYRRAKERAAKRGVELVIQ